MPSTFFGLEIGRRALTANQLALDVTGQNTSNVGTAGYSRQVAVFEASEPIGAPGVDSSKPAQLGTGVTVASVNRVRDQYIDGRIYLANSDQGALSNLRDILSRVETAYGEPSTTGVGSQLTAFFNSFSDLAAAPESAALRSTVINKAQGLVAAFRTVGKSLGRIGPEIQSRIASGVSDVNSIAGRIATLNRQISSSLYNGDHPNDLLDKRTALVNQLSGLVDVQVIDTRSAQTNLPTGEIQIDVGGFTLVRGDSSSPLPATVAAQSNSIALQTADGQAIPLRSGAVFGLIKASGLVSGYQGDLDTLASSLISATNAQHSAGSGLDGVSGRAFFTGTSAATIAVASAITNNPDAIAAASPPVPPATVAPGNGDNARALASLNATAVIGSSTLDQYYNGKVASIGSDSQRFQADADNQTKVVAQLTNQQASISGVNLDEELTKMLQYQRAYQAAARIVNVQDSVLNTIINGLGLGTTAA